MDFVLDLSFTIHNASIKTEIKCLLIYSLKKGDLIELVSNDISTEARIAEISDISDFVMTLKLLVVNNERK